MDMPKLIVMRGIVGSGKSHVVKSTFAVSEVFSTDDFWGPLYDYDPKRIGEAHVWNWQRYKKYVEKVVPELLEGRGYVPPFVVVDNTNISGYEISPYIMVANANNMDHEIITVQCDPWLAARRNVHKVPADVVFAMYQRLLKEELPSFWKKRTILAGE